ncbi:MAG: hypothetical protein WCJ26_13895 [bacterium]
MKINNKFLLILLVLLSPVAARSSVKLDFTTVDMLTFRLYQEKKWDSLIGIGHQALRQDIDYYYLRVRMGIAYFEQKEYFPATTHLKKAMQFNSGDQFVADYLYRAYVYTNRPEEANILRKTMSPQARDTALVSNAILQSVHVEAGYTFSSDRAPKNLTKLMDTANIYGEQDLYGNSIYSNLSLNLRVSNRIGLTLAYNYLNFSKTKYIQYGQLEHQLTSITDTSWGKLYNYATPNPWIIYDTSFKYQVKQHEIHIGASISSGAGFRIMPAFHLIHVAYTMTNITSGFETRQDPWYYTNFNSTLYSLPFEQLNYTFSQKDTSFNNYVAALEITKDFGLFKAGLSGSWSNLNNKKQKQVGVSLTYFPLGNLNFYGTTAVTGFFQGKNKRLLLSQILGAKITSWLWGEVNFYYGDYTNANIFNGSIVYNNSDIIDYRGGATLIFAVSKHIQLSLIYQYFRKESEQIYYIKTPDTSNPGTFKEIPQTKNNPYNTNTIIGGITWKF